MERITADRLLQAFEEQETMLKEVKKLGASNRLLTTVVRLLVIIVGVLVAVIIGGVVLTVNSSHTANTATVASKQATASAKQVEDLLVQFKAQQAAVALTSCQVRNNANRVNRMTFAAYTDSIDGLISDPDTRVRVDAALRKAIPDPAVQDRDCTDPPNGLGPEDYPAG